MYRYVCIALALAAGVAVAQEARRPNPADPGLKAGPAAYRSAFDGYRSFADEEVGDWRRANEDVGAAGGHAGHRPAQGAGRPGTTPPPGPGESPDRPRSQDHGGRNQ